MMASSELSLYYQNVRGLKSKITEFYTNLLLSNFDFIALSETWLNESIFSRELFDNRYIVYRKDRDFIRTQKRDGGGVALAVKSSFSTERMFELETNDVESVWIKVYQEKNKTVLVGVVYFPPDSARDCYKSFFRKIEDSALGSDIMLIGDFNLKNLSSYFINNNFTGFTRTDLYVLQRINFFNFIQSNRVYNINNYCLDLVLTNLTLCNVYEAVFPLVPVDYNYQNFPGL